MRLPTGRLWLLRLLLVVVTAAVTLTVMQLLDSPVADVQRPADPDGLTGTVLPAPYTLRDATLTTTSGASLDLHDGLEAPVTLLFFGYTNCDDVCSTVLSNITSAKARLTDEQAAAVDTWFVTTDPVRDDPATVGAYLERFDPEFTGLTGPLDALMATASSVHVAMQAGRKLPSGGYEVVHGTPVLAVLPDGSVPVVWTEDTSAAELAADLDEVLTDGVPQLEAAS
ncbi:MAG: Cytochrome oxidase biogenesis protein Sco1/SenC/PrrC, thiol-disulfide reductase involved in Cu(I) insertion into CoxII Cu(A) center [uncultured Nocardioides sp.]|uniref:Cytochrome oxidase biogenesis protein Sco1/SenC/PrrC, thiol-disulfide reductase involved in Cu(I) insertion into CoxII Cu(A) center n=1 Tax=uncultured Nocardioides sp. TaxID=198441 RepID=A0A6J4N7N1_9ACTN|nr:MAG: Cytochrome oxidase biogenesis protein Sco1/SenC/PrrC, thiol-disulfide reductase involved in Cu(I) insertion into CoxII Cu(A) center [uncultured Nocardioides sp.]